MQDFPATVIDDEPCIQQLESNGRNDEELHARNHVPVISEEGGPALPFLLVGSSLREIARDGGEAHGEAELLEIGLDLSCPPSVLAGQAARSPAASRRARTARPNRSNRTAETRLRENGGPSRGRASHPGVSAWGSPRRSAKTPRNGGKSAVGARSGRGFSGVADYLAVRAVYRELVSGPKSLIHRENTGKSPKSRLLGEASVSDPAPLDVLAGEFPAFGNREISANEHGFQPGRRTQGRERRSCQPPVFGNCWRFGSADFWHTTPGGTPPDRPLAAPPGPGPQPPIPTTQAMVVP